MRYALISILILSSVVCGGHCWSHRKHVHVVLRGIPVFTCIDPPCWSVLVDEVHECSCCLVWVVVASHGTLWHAITRTEGNRPSGFCFTLDNDPLDFARLGARDCHRSALATADVHRP